MFSYFLCIFVIFFSKVIVTDVKASNDLDTLSVLEGKHENKIISIKMNDHLYFFCEKYNDAIDENKWE